MSSPTPRFVPQQSLDLMFPLSMTGVRPVPDSGQGECVCMRLCTRGCARVCTCKYILGGRESPWLWKTSAPRWPGVPRDSRDLG